MRASTPKPEYLRRLFHRRSRLETRRFPMPSGRPETRLGRRIARLEIRISKVERGKI